MQRGETTTSKLVGRASELGYLQRFVASSALDGGALLVTGEPGVGKTALLAATERICSSTHTRVLKARGVEFEADLPYAALHQLLLPLHAEFDQLRESHRVALDVALGFGIGDPPDRLVASNAALSVLQKAAAASPLVVIVDDVPWVDRASAVVLGFVARRLAGTRVGLLVAARLGEESLFDRAGLPELEVGPLDDYAAGELITARFPQIADVVRQRLLTEAQGNPLALLELPAALSGGHGTSLPAPGGPLPINRRLQQLFASRIGSLPRPTRDLLLVMALDGTGELRVPKHAAGQDRWSVHFSSAERAQLAFVDAVTHRPTFRHPLIRSAIVELATGDERRRAHETLGELWAEQPERRAWHLSQATVEPDEQVADVLERAAYQILARGDGVGAVSALTRAAELSPREVDRSRRLAEAAFIGADVTGELRDAARLLAAANQADPHFTQTLQAAVTAAYVLINGEGDVDTAHRLLVGAIERAGEAGATALEEALATLTLICFFGGRAELWEPFYTALARLEPDVPHELMLIKHCFADPVRAPPEVLPKLEQALADLESETDPTVVLKVGFAAGNTDRLWLGRRAFLRLVTAGRETGTLGSVIQALTLVAFDDWWSGRWDDAMRSADEGLALCSEYGFPLFALSLRHVKAAVAAARGDELAAESTLEALIQWGAPRGVGLTKFVCGHVRTIAALGRSDFEGAYQYASQISPVGTLASHVLMAPWVMMDVVESAMRTGRTGDAEAHLAAMQAADVARVSSRYALLVAGSAALTAPSDRASAMFEEAVGLRDADRWPLLHARVKLAYGEHLRRIRSTKESRIQLSEALNTFERLGARHFVDRAAAELRATGQTRHRSEDLDRDALTPQELEIAMLAASGLSNKEIAQRLFLSHRTIGTHLYRIFPKLGINSRAALRDALAALPPDREAGSV
jgi:DNA-binding CsgD family transcriptional regulator